MKEGARKPGINFRVNDTTTIDTSSPVDFSFKSLRELTGIGIEGIRSTRVGRIPERGSESRRYLTRSIWLNNNKLTNMENVEALVHSALEQPEKLGWIDFSFNYITHLDEGILKFPNLKILYLHGNLISSLDEIFKLRKLPLLRTLTLHGNPICEDPKYRMIVVTYLPQLVNLDFSPITKQERLKPKPPEAVRKIMLSEEKQN